MYIVLITGCGRINDKHPDVELPIWKKSPGLCYSLCNTSDRSYIGLNNDKVSIPSKEQNFKI